jgi:hypothetical protein
MATKADAQFDQSSSLAFMHVPKTAGTSLAVGLVSGKRCRAALLAFERLMVLGDLGIWKARIT